MDTTQRMNDLCNRPVGEVVAEDYRRAEAFKKYGIDFCCGGGKSVKEASEAMGVSCDDLLQALAAVESATEGGVADHLDVRSWEPDFLASYVVNIHHRYVRETTPKLLELTKTVARVHGGTHPESVKIAELMEELAQELDEHMAKEEQEYFPYVEALCAAARNGKAVLEASDADVEELEHEHDAAGGLMKQIRTLSRDFDVSGAPCNTSRIAYNELAKFETDLHRHVHLENNVLFPAVARLNKELEGFTA